MALVSVSDDSVLSLPDPVAPSSEDLQSILFEGSSKLFASIAYTLVFEYCNDLIAKGVDSSIAVSTARDVCNKWLDDPIKIRKRPSTRDKKPKDQKHQSRPKAGKIDAKSAIKRLQAKNDYNWKVHPVDSRLMYSTDLQLATGYPVKNPKDDIVAVATDSNTVPLTPEDAQAAVNLGFKIDINYF